MVHVATRSKTGAGHRHRPHGLLLKLISAILGKKTYFLALNHSSDLTYYIYGFRLQPRTDRRSQNVGCYLWSRAPPRSQPGCTLS